MFTRFIKFIVLTGLIVTLYPLEISAQVVEDSGKSTGKADCPCLQSKVRFDVSSVEKIILYPEKILADPDKFWKEDDAYQYLQQWHDRINQPPDLEKWRHGIEKLRDLSQSKREKHPQLIAARNLDAIEESFVVRVVPYLCGFLPPEADLSTTIYFTTEMISAGFEASGNIVIHILNHEVHNLFVHELLHRGVASMQQLSDNPLRSLGIFERMYWNLYNEGYATYVGYAGREEFPHIGKVGYSLVAGDYKMLDEPEEIERLHAGLCKMFREAGTMDTDSLQNLSWEFGVNQRAYYVVGAYMAKTIDETLGRQIFIETLKKGSQAFLKTYNSIADDKWKIPEIQ